MRRIHPARPALLAALLLVPGSTAGGGVQATGAEAAPGPETYRALAAEVDAMLERHVLGVWFPHSVDTERGGFHARFTPDWERAPSGGRFSVFQGRMTWVAAQVAMRRPALRERYLAWARHGVAFLGDVLWDAEHGGFFWGVGDDGSVSPRFGDGKHLYGISFCIYGAAAAHQASGDPGALELARRAFRWVDEHAHDALHGGYHEALRRDGTPLDRQSATAADRRSSPFPIGYKSMNTHIHLLEAFTQLYLVWPDPLLRARLVELLELVRDRVAVEPGVLHLYFTPDWRPVPDHDSYGHDVETAYLLLEAAHALGLHEDQATGRMARLLVDHALEHGWDERLGGFVREGTTFHAEDPRKEWWVEFEGLNALLLMHELHGAETDRYFRAFVRQWRYLQHHQIDSEGRGVYTMVGADGAPVEASKAHDWKAAYHDGRALLNVAERLRALAARP
jgi:mannobiose 2-epimerase